MFGFLIPLRSDSGDPLASPRSAESWASGLRLDDPLHAQRALSAAVGRLGGARTLEPRELDALLALDRRAQTVVDALLVRYVERQFGARGTEQNLWLAMAELAQAFAQAYDLFFRQIRENAGQRKWAERLPAVLTFLFQYRQVDAILRLFRYEPWIPARWRELHDVYAYAQDRGINKEAVVVRLPNSRREAAFTVEQQYVQILLLQLLNSGQFTPREALEARNRFARWCSVLHLSAAKPGADGPGFVVDLGSMTGLRRSIEAPAGRCFRLDTTPLTVLIDDEIAAARDAPAADAAEAESRARQVGLLRRLRHMLAPDAMVATRRGERIAESSSVQCIVGLRLLCRALRDEQRRRAAATLAALPELEEITVMGVGEMRSPRLDDDDPSTLLPLMRARAVGAELWQVKDASESGALLRGEAGDETRLVPGTLFAMRPDEDSPWTVTVVRRMRRFPGGQVEIGVERLGVRPRRIIMVGDYSRQTLDDIPVDARPRFAGLVLPPSEGHPQLPIRTLVLPAAEARPDRLVTVFSLDSNYTFRLKEAIARFEEFAWTAFELVDRWPADPLKMN